MPTTTRLLCTGDIHIGRPPSGLPTALDAREVSPAAVWDLCVESAIEHAVDAVVLTGDIVDRANRFFEAYGPLERGLRALAERAIPVFAVAGNHDFDVLRRLAAVLGAERFHLLGDGGNWERKALTRNGQTLANFDGWSFPAERVRSNPLDSYSLPSDGDIPTIGLLHADVDQLGSPYAPVALSDLQARPLTAWLLGHVHAPRQHEQTGAPLVLYPGSPQPLDVTETGPHGPWLIEVDRSGVTRAEQVPLATLRHEIIDVDTAGLATPEALQEAVCSAVQQEVERIVGVEPGPLRYLCYRIRLVGRTRLHRRAGEALRTVSDLSPARNEVTALIDSRIINATVPDRDLRELATARDQHSVAALARLALALCSQGDSDKETQESIPALMEDVRQKVDQLRHSTAYREVSSEHVSAEPGEADIRQRLTHQATRLLDALLAQKESPE